MKSKKKITIILGGSLLTGILALMLLNPLKQDDQTLAHHTQGSIAGNKQLNPTQNNEQQNQTLSSNMEALLKEVNIPLTISQHEERFIPANDFFTSRLLSLLRDSINDEWQSEAKADKQNAQVRFRFEGYVDIYFNAELNMFWFEGSDQVYHLNNTEVWPRYMIKIVNNQLTYAGFEKTVLYKKTISPYRDEEAVIYYDGNIHLQVHDTDIILNDVVDEHTLLSHDAHYPSDSYGIEVLDDKGLFMLYSAHKGMSPFYKVRVYQSGDGKVMPIWSSLDMDSYINYVDLDNKTIDIALQPMLDSKVIGLSNAEAERMYAHFDTLKNNGILDENFWQDIKENLLYEMIHVTTLDYDHDEKKELLMTISFHTVGAKTPPFDQRAILVYSIENKGIVYKDLIMESENTNEQLDSLFRTTIPQTVMTHWE
ncbi:hypothetical protein HZI73_12285 [Vallitalea pronyensis]|uniref:Uncharacterized protein n=1 Tax=Vallitalea pronyensis TaxID=1348613 RepID=A0A8J8SGX3_9FIRM|nr:hypothetical protein [Vallitalea pronyensis]QUI23021.1 hypothetical protein HZI73_12285 [Vallitalea pronyensis]